MSYSVGPIEIFDTYANMTASGAGAPGILLFASDTGLLYQNVGGVYTQYGKTRVDFVTSSATPTINAATTDLFLITALGVAITSVTVTGLTSMYEGQPLDIRIKDAGVGKAVALGTSFVAGASAILTTTIANKTHLSRFKYDAVAQKLACYYSDATGY